MAINVLTVHYNTPELLDAMIRSVNKNTDCKIYVFDNSDSSPFVNTFDNVEVIDNTKGQIFDFDEWLAKFPDKQYTSNGWGSAKHCKTVDLCFDLIPDGFILLDSDVLIYRDISELWDSRYIGAGQLEIPRHPVSIRRICPYVCYINVPMCRKHDVRYFDDDHMWFLTAKSPNRWYDTGAWFYENCDKRGVTVNLCSCDDYCVHLGAGSWRDLDKNLQNKSSLKRHKDLFFGTPEEWLAKYKYLYE